jgi:hypothetical protein
MFKLKSEIASIALGLFPNRNTPTFKALTACLKIKQNCNLASAEQDLCKNLFQLKICDF